MNEEMRDLLKAALYALDDVHACEEPEVPDEILARVAATVDRLRRALGVENVMQTTHSEGCWSLGPTHYMCAYNYIKRLERYKDDGK